MSMQNGPTRVALAVVAVCFLFADRAHSQQKLDLVGRSVKAITYQHRSGATTSDFRGTPLLDSARGTAKVENKRGYLEVDAEFSGLAAARTFGTEDFTYVLWAITPEGCAF